MQDYYQYKYTYTAAVDFNSTGDTVVITPATPIDIYRWGFIALANVNVTAGEVALDHRPLAASDSGRVQIQTMTFSSAQDLVAGEMYYADVFLPNAETTGEDNLSVAGGFGGNAAQVSAVNTGPDGPWRVDPGGQVVLEIVGAFDAAGTCICFIQYCELSLFNMAAAATRLNFKGSGDTAAL